MKKGLIALLFLLVASCFIRTETGQAAGSSGGRLIALHDRILPLTDIRVIEGDTVAALDEMARFLYMPVENEKGKIVIRKYGTELSFDPKTGVTAKDGESLKFTPIRQLDGKTFISVKYIARELGFELHYFQNEKTIRIYRDSYPHVTHEEFEKVIAAFRAKQEAEKPKPETSLKPDTASKPAPGKTPKPVKTQKPVPGKTAKPKPATPGETTVYLTFDDGPNKFTTTNLATLKKHDVRATFFFLGKHMKTYPKIVEAAANDGHYIGSHGMTHDKELVYKSAVDFIKEMDDSTKLIKHITGKETHLVRVPYGSKPHVTPDMQKKLTAGHYKMWDWTVDSNDWRYTEKEAGQIIENVKKGVADAAKAGDRNIVILLHDRVQTTKALPAIIEWLQQEGYQFAKYEPEHHIVKNFLHDQTL